MTFTVLTLFPDIVSAFFGNSIMAKAIEKGLIDYNIVDIRDFAMDKHRTCDDATYGGGAGMVLKAEPLAGALDFVHGEDKRVVYPAPSGKLFNQRKAAELSAEQELVFICGRYEGIDQRIIDLYVDDELSIGDYVISSGEIASLVIIDAVYRLVDGVINGESLEEESFTDGLLEYPHYTRPQEFRNLAVPDILLSGNHAEIERWRRQKRIEKTEQNRPELLQ
jgi:tRNA (guanine37-N1)-methyltransferase